MPRPAALLRFLCALLLLGAAPALAQPTTVPAGFDAYVEKALGDWEVPGVSVSVVKDGNVVLAKGYGVRRLGGTAKVDAHTQFAIGSISKSVTAMAVGLLVDEGKLGWDDKVGQHLPTFQLYDPYVTRELTVRDLLTHRSGLPEVSGGILWYGSDYSRTEVLERFRHVRPVSSFRSTFAYQNVMYVAAGEVVRSLSGKSWDAFIRERLFTPLGMKDTHSLYADLKRSRNLASPHVRIDGKPVAIEYRDSDAIGPAGSIMSSAHDMSRYMQLLLGQGTFAGKKLYSPEVAKELFTAQTLVPLSPSTRPETAHLAARFHAYGLGWFLRDYRGRKLVQHTGGMDGMAAVTMLLPEENLGITVLSPQDGGLFAALAYWLLDGYLGASELDWSAVMLKYRAQGEQKAKTAEAERTAARVSGTKPSLALTRYAGPYRDRMYGDLSVVEEKGRLVLRFSHSPAFTADLEHWHYDTFRIHWRDPKGFPKGFLTFALDAKGQPTRFTFDQPKLLDVDFRELSVERVPDAPPAAAGAR